MRYCRFDGCTNVIEHGAYCAEHQRTGSRRKKKQTTKSAYHHENKPFYRTQEWKDLRTYIYERNKGCCERCGRFVFGKQAHVHHIIPIKENESLKLEKNNLMLLCPQCHMIVENEDNEGPIFPGYFH